MVSCAQTQTNSNIVDPLKDSPTIKQIMSRASYLITNKTCLIVCRPIWLGQIFIVSSLASLLVMFVVVFCILKSVQAVAEICMKK